MLSYCSDDFLHFGEDVYVLTLFLFVQHLSFYSGPVRDFRAPVHLQVSIRSTSRSFYSDPAWKLIIDLHLGVYIRARAGSFYSGCISEFLFGHRLGVSIRTHLGVSIWATPVSFFFGPNQEIFFRTTSGSSQVGQHLGRCSRGRIFLPFIWMTFVF
jgi:hypothetical protein